MLEKGRFFDPNSRSGVGGFPYKWREFITEIIKENEGFEWIWVKTRFLAANLKKDNYKLSFSSIFVLFL